MTDDSVLLADLYSHQSLNEFIAYDEAMCQCPDVCRCPGMDDNEGDPQMKSPLCSEPIRTLLIPIALAAFIAAAQAFMAGADTRGIITAVLGALVIAAQELGRSLVTPVPKPGSQDGYGIVEAILIVFLVAVCLIVLFHFA